MSITADKLTHRQREVLTVLVRGLSIDTAVLLQAYATAQELPLGVVAGMRAMAERSVEQAKLAFNNYIQAAQEAVSTFEQWGKASQVGAQGISKKAISYAERNVLSAFEFAQKIVQVKDIQELVRMQTEFVQSQIQVLSEQVKDMGETATKTAMDSVKDLGEAATKAAEIATNTAMESVKDLSETATKAAMESETV
jgi:phasin